MIQIALSEYLAEIDQLIEDQRFVESIAHCRHILQQHPRHVGTYRMLGKALLEQQNYHDAADVFQRVLSADPEDFIAHVGMSIISKEDTLLPQAVWHMERAHEMDPYNLVIRDELMALYEQRDNRLPKTLTLSRSALARLYARSEMYLLAAAELRQLLAADENRMDLMTLLAETLWQAGQRVDAVDVCLEILERLPNSIKANAILAEVWLTTGRGEEANEFVDALSRLILPERGTLADNGLVATVYATEGAPSLPLQQMVHYLDYVPEAEGGTEDIVPQWVDELNLVDESALADPDAAVVDDIPTPLPLTDVPSWFNDLGDEGQPTEEPPSETSLDWLRDVAVSRAEPAMADEQVGYDESYSAPDSQGDIVAEMMASSPAEDIPDWLGGILEEQDGDSLLDSLVGPDRSAPEVEALSLLPAEEPDESDWNDWDAVDLPGLADDSADDLTWLHDDAAEGDVAADSEGEEFTWLENSASPVVDVSAAVEEDFDWLDAEVDNQQDPAPAEPIPAAADLDDFDWLEDGERAWLPAEEPAAALAPADSADNLLDLDDLPAMAEEWTLSGSEEHFMDLHDKPGNEDEEISSESESSSPTSQQPEDGALDWLQDLADAEPTHTGLLRSASADEPLPDWLSQDISDGSLAKELPDWLAEDSLVSGSDLSATVTDHEMIIPDVDRGTGELSQAVFPDEPADALDELIEDEDVSEDLSWLDAMPPVDEPPTLSWADSGVTPVPTEEPPTPPAALRVPDPEPEPADDEMSIFDNWQDDTVRMSAEEFAALQKAAGFGAEAESPSDAEIAMDWLDELSESPEMDMDGASLMAPETEIMASSDPELTMAPEDEAEAMDWLEDLSGEFEIDAGVTDLSDVSDDLELFEESLEPPSSGELTWLDELSQPVVDEETGETLLGPDDGSVAASGETVSAKDLDSAEVMAWLDELAELPENEEPGTVVDDDLLPDLLGSAVELPVAEVEVNEEEDSDAMAWLDQLATEFADEETGETAMATDIDDLLAEMPESEGDIVEMQMAAPEPPQVIVDGQVVPDLDIEPTDDPLSEADAMAWLEDLIQDEVAVEAELDETVAPVDGTDWADAGIADEFEAEAPYEAPQVIVDGQVVPDLDIEPTDDPLSEADAMAWLDEFISEVDQVPQDEAIPDGGIMEVEMVTAVSEPLAPDRPDTIVPEAEVEDDGLAALAFLEELALTGDIPLDSAEPAVESPAIEPAANIFEDEPIITRALPTEPEMSLEDLADEIPEDPDEAMDWIRSMAEEEPDASEDEMDMSWLDAFADETDEVEAVADLSLFPADEVEAEAAEQFESPVMSEPESPFGSLDLGNMPIEDLFDLPDGDLPDDIAAQMTQLGSTDALSDDILADDDEGSVFGSATPVDEGAAVDLADLFGNEALSEDLFGEADDAMLDEDLFAGLIEPDGDVAAEPVAGLDEILPEDSLADDLFAADIEEDEVITPEPEVAEAPAESLAMEVTDLFAEDAAEELFAELELESDDVMADLFGDDSDMAAMDLEDLLAEEAEAEADIVAIEPDVMEMATEDAPEPEPRQPIAIADLPAAAEPAGDTEPDMTTAEPVSEVEADEPAALPDTGPFPEPDLMNSQVQGTLPDWLIDDDEAAPDSIGWMEAIGDSSVTDWLTAEEESLSSTFEAIDTDSLAVPGTGPLDERKLPRGDTGPLDASRVTRAPTEPLPQPEPVAPPVAATPPADMDMDRLQAARAAVRAASFAEAVTGYNELLQRGVGLDVLIGDLRNLQQTQPNALLVRLLGDVYMRDGQLQNALDSYRQALDLM